MNLIRYFIIVFLALISLNSVFAVIVDAVHYYTHDNLNTIGTTSYDRIGNSNGVLTNGVTSGITGLINEGFDFNDVDNEYIYFSSLGANGWFGGQQDHSISVWAKFDSTNGGYIYYDRTADGIIYIRNVVGTNKIEFGVYDGTEGAYDVIQYDLGSIITAQYNHFVLNLDYGTTNGFEVYVNGVSRGTDTVLSRYTSGNVGTYLGRDDTAGSNRLNGQIDELGIYNRVLTPSDISDLYNGGAGNQFPIFDTWTTLNNMPYSAYTGGAVTIGDKIYVFGGENPTRLDYNYLYNITTDSYTLKANIPTTLSFFASASVGDSYYIIGGMTGTTNVNSVYKYNSTTNSWSTMANYPLSNRALSCTTDGTDIYCFNGYTTSNVNNAYKYDVSANSWSALTNVPFSVRGGNSVYYNGLIYLAGGYSTTSTNYFYSYNITSNSYTALTNLPANRNSGHIIAGSGSVWYAGGSDGTNPHLTNYKYNISSNSWTNVNSMNTAKFAGMFTTYNGSMYVFGGYAGGYLNNVQKYEAFIPHSPSPDIPTLTIDAINLVNNTITNQSILNINLNLTNTSTNGLVNTTLYLSNSSNYQIGTNTLNVDYNLTMNEGSYNLWTYSFNNETNVTSSNYSYLFDYTAPTIDIIGNITQTDFEVNFSTIFNVTDALSGLSSCYINITYLENITNASQYNSFINCTDTQQFYAVGDYNGFLTATDNAGNIETLSVNGTIEPLIYLNFFDENASAITEYNIRTYLPNNTTQDTINTSNPLGITPFQEGELILGIYYFEFEKDGYLKTNVSLNLNETSGGASYNFTMSEVYINIQIKEIINNSLTNPSNFTILFYNIDQDITQTFTISNNNTYQIRNVYADNTNIEINLIDELGQVLTNKILVLPHEDLNLSFYLASGYNLSERGVRILNPSLIPITFSDVEFYIYLPTSGEFVLLNTIETDNLGIVKNYIIPSNFFYNICHTYDGVQKCLNQIIFNAESTKDYDYEIVHTSSLTGSVRNILNYIEWSYNEIKTDTTSQFSFYFDDTQQNTDYFCLNVSRNNIFIGSYCSTTPSGAIVQTFSLTDGDFIDYEMSFFIDGQEQLLYKVRSYSENANISELGEYLNLFFFILFFGLIGYLVNTNKFDLYVAGLSGFLLITLTIQAVLNQSYTEPLLWGFMTIKSLIFYYVRND